MAMRQIDPRQVFDGLVLVLAPHMDDDLLGCGGVLSSLAGHQTIRLLYCADGRGILQPGRGPRQHNHGEEKIGEIRRSETLRGLAELGLRESDARFLPFPEWQLGKHAAALANEVRSAIGDWKPRYVLAPFRFDKHPDHVALNRIVRQAHKAAAWNGPLLEYFVYREWKLLRGARNVRDLLNPELVVTVQLEKLGGKKRRALECHRSQTTVFYPWQRKPVLSSALLDSFCTGTEDFLWSVGDQPDRVVITVSPALLRVLNWLEPRLKNAKERMLQARHRG
jgi:LmbE family N-acetylglucosaminyl deacetylase